MALFDIFLSPEKKKGKAHLRNLLSVAMADGKMEDAEYEFLTVIALKYHIPMTELDQMKSEIAKKGGFALEKDGLAFDQIFDLVNMMMIDNNINPNELKMCKNFAKRIGYSTLKVDELIESIVQNISIGHTVDETRSRVAYLIK